MDRRLTLTWRSLARWRVLGTESGAAAARDSERHRAVGARVAVPLLEPREALEVLDH